jgi:glucose/arabinose dehydrogenase
VPPALTFPYQSHPGGIVFYPFDDPEGWDYWHNDLIVTLSGSWDLPEPAGYALVAVNFGDDARPDGAITRLAPASSPLVVYYSDTLAEFSLLGRGFFPYHPVDVVVSAEGWLYVSLQEGRILRFRPRPAAQATAEPTPTQEP